MNRFGISTHLFHEQPLSREHLVHIAAHGFEAIELFATRAHFDYHDQRAIAELAEWLADTRLELHSVHAPIVGAVKGGKWIDPFSNASRNEASRKTALQETQAAIVLARHIPYRHLVVHLGTPTTERIASNDNQPELARRTVEKLFEEAGRENVHVALEVIPNALSKPEALVHLIEDELDGIDVGICLDYGHAHLMGDLGEAIETVSGHLLTTHMHDNGGQRDDHMVPYSGSIDWDVAMMETQKVGYDGTLMFEVAAVGDPIKVLQRCVKARERLEQTFVTF
ncbi:MAG TPA: sugar phosphate isomerase/epimerase family protein [Vicinamibacterales bacterium]|nr:sugar phosphate isomerase/epimerase family protein [Vicinamibacterales bacterium]